MLWEKEIRRAKKESFKSQSAVVKLQEELKGMRNSLKAAQADFEEERERCQKREQEAFAARYKLVGVQEELVQLTEKVKLLEQERDALKTIAKNEEIARIAAEGQIPLPQSSQDDEFASPKKERASRISIPFITSAASEDELEEYRTKLEWEKRRVDEAHARIEFLEVECRLNCCISRAARNASGSYQAPAGAETELFSEGNSERTSHVFIASEGIFRPVVAESPKVAPAESVTTEEVETPNKQKTEAYSSYARTPSCEPPSRAMVVDANTSLLSLLEAPHSPAQNHNDTEEEQEEPTVIETFRTISTTTRIPLADPEDSIPPEKRTFDSTNPALSQTMSKEEALAQIRERRGRARSLAQGTLTPRKQMVEGGIRRDISAPDVRSGTIRGRSRHLDA